MRITLGLYNGYDPKQWHDIMRITLARAGPIALAFDMDLATFGFPYAQARKRGAKRNVAGLDTPMDVADFVAEDTSIGDGGVYLQELAKQGRFHLHPFPAQAFPVKLGKPVLTTPHPDPARQIGVRALADACRTADHLIVFGLGPRGLPESVLATPAPQLELTGKNISLETATALGALPAMLRVLLDGPA